MPEPEPSGSGGRLPRSPREELHGHRHAADRTAGIGDAGQEHVDRQVRLQHPWPGRTIVVNRVGGGTVAHTVSDNVTTFPTQAGATYTIAAP